MQSKEYILRTRRHPLFQVASACCLLALSACDGSSGSGTPSATANKSIVANSQNSGVSAPGRTGSVSENFVPGTRTPRYVLLSNTVRDNQATTDIVQSGNGSVATLGSYVLSGNPGVTEDIAGDASFAMGRWVWGTVTNTSTNATLDVMNDPPGGNAAWHYVVLNPLSSLPATGSKKCDSGTFTEPTFIAGVSAGSIGTTQGSSATLGFSKSGANLAFTLTTEAGSVSGTSRYSAGNLTAGGGTVPTGNVVGVGNSAASIAFGDGGNGAVRVGGVYSIVLSNGGTYQGAYSFLCS